MDFSHLLDKEMIAPLIATGAVLGTVFGVVIKGWKSIKEFFSSFTSIFITHIEFDDERTSKIVLSYLIQNYKRYQPRRRVFSGRHDSFRNGKFGHISFEMFNQTLMFWNGWIPFWYVLKKEQQTEENKTSFICWDKPETPPLKATLVFWRFTIDADKIIEAASKFRNEMYWNKSDQRRFFIKKVPDPNQDGLKRYSAGTNLEWFNEGIYRLSGYNQSELGKAYSVEDGKSATENLYFPPHVKSLIEEAKTWHKLKDWYVKRGIAWKRGWCLYGPPGTGKTALVRAIAEDLDMPLFVYSLGHMTDTDLERSWNDMQAHTPCIALFEDFDTVFHGRENIYGKPNLAEQIAAAGAKVGEIKSETSANKGQLSFGCLLNCIDGADKANGIFTVITTNHIDKLDIALGQPRTNDDGTVEFISTRPGRIDKAIELGYMQDNEKVLFAEKIFSEDPKGLEIMLKNVNDNPGVKETPAQFQERCTQLALELLWKEADKVKVKVEVEKPKIQLPKVKIKRNAFGFKAKV